MVALRPAAGGPTGAESAPNRPGGSIEPRTTRADAPWLLAAAVVLCLGLGLRVVLGSGTVGDRSAAVLAALLAVATWLAARLVLSARAAFGVAVVAVALLDLGALPPRAEPGYDDRQALYRPDQSIVLPAVAPAALAEPVLTLLVEPSFTGSTPRFGLAGEVAGVTRRWRCAFGRGRQLIGLPLSPVPAGGPYEVRLWLTDAPAPDGDFLSVYSSARQPVLTLVEAGALTPEATLCAPGAG